MTRDALSRRRFLAASGPAGALLAAAPDIDAAPKKTILEMARAAERLTGVDIIDAHTHINDSPPGRIWPQNAADLVDDMDRCGIPLAVFSHLAALTAYTAEEVARAHESSARAVKQFPTRLRGYAVFHPHHLDESLRGMQRVLDPGSGFIGFKLHGSFHQYPADGPNYKPLYEFANQHSLPVLFHVGGMGRDWSGAVAQIADRYPNMNLIFAHLAPGEDRMASLFKGRRNLHTDTCLSTGRYRQVERVVRLAGVERVVFATDGGFNSCVAGFGKVVFADLPDQEKRMILGGNARRLFGHRLPHPGSPAGI